MKYQLNQIVGVKEKKPTASGSGVECQWDNRIFAGFIRKIEITDKGAFYWIKFGPEQNWKEYEEKDIEGRFTIDSYIEVGP